MQPEPMRVSHLGPDTTLAWVEWEQTIADFNGLCAYCLERPNEELEHFRPRSKGGKTEIANCLPACRQCNLRKTDLTGKALIAVFGIATLERLRQYLELRSGKPVVIPPDEPDLSHKKTSKIRLVVKEIAEAQGIKQYQLAEKSGVTPQLLNRYWNNNIQRVDLEELNKIAIALGVAPGDLIAGGNSSPDLDEAA